jgi:hypothetical protein
MADFESMPLISFLDPYKVRTRDEMFRVVIERKLYDSHGSSRLDGSEYESGSGSSVLSSLGVGGSQVEDTQDTYSWSSRLGYVPDKDAIADRTINYVGRRGLWEDYEDDGYGYGSSGSPGKRGSKRGPRGVRPRQN